MKQQTKKPTTTWAEMSPQAQRQYFRRARKVGVLFASTAVVVFLFVVAEIAHAARAGTLGELVWRALQVFLWIFFGVMSLGTIASLSALPAAMVDNLTGSWRASVIVWAVSTALLSGVFVWSLASSNGLKLLPFGR